MGRPKKATAQHRRAPAAVLPPPPPPSSSEDEEEDEEAAEFRREAAELLRQKRQTALPGGLTQARLDQAARMMAGQMGVDRQLAEDALLATAEQHCQDPDEWYNEAGMWLAVQSEVQDEAAKLKEAMQVSLREQQAAREAEAAAPPLALLSEERLRKKFHASVVLKHLSRLGAVLPDWVLFSDRMPLREKVKHKLVELLRLEADCNKWWPERGTQKYFEDAAERFCEQLGQASSSRADGAEATLAAAGAGKSAAPPAPAPAPAAPAAAAATKGSGEPSIPGDPASTPPSTSHGAGADGGPTSSVPGGAPAVSAAAVSAAAVSAAAGAGTSRVAGVRCGSTPEAEAPSEPCSTAGADDAAGEEGATTAGERLGKRKRQPPARYRSPSPAVSSDGRKRQCSTPPAGEAASKRQASLDCHAAAAKDSSTARRSASPSPASVEDRPAAAAAAAAAASDSMQQQDRSKPLQQPPPPPPQQQQQQAMVADGGGDPLTAVLPAGERLSRLLEDELQQLRHHVFNMPLKACAVPAIFQTADEQQADGEGGADSDVELVDVKQPTGGTDIPEPPEFPARSPAATPAPTPPAEAATAAAAAAAAAAQVQAAMAAAAAAAGGVQRDSVTPGGLSPATLTSLYMAGFAGPSSSSLAAFGASGQQQQQSEQMQGQGQGQLGGRQQFRQMYDPDDFEYRASTNKQGTLVIEID